MFTLLGRIKYTYTNAIAYGYSCTAVPPDDAELTSLAKGFTTALTAVYGTQYTYGSSCRTIYKTTGSSDDYAYDVQYVHCSFLSSLLSLGFNTKSDFIL